MSTIDMLNIDTIFLKKNKRTILCKNSYERMLVHKFAREHGLKSETITMPETHKRLRCPRGCNIGTLRVHRCNCISGRENCDLRKTTCPQCGAGHMAHSERDIRENRSTTEPVKAVVLTRRKVMKLPRAFSDVTIVTQS